jgi:hypothetical protein
MFYQLSHIAGGKENDMAPRHLVRALGIGGIFGVMLLAASTLFGGGTAQASGIDGHWPAWIQGRPLSLEPGGTTGFYFWHGVGGADDGLNLYTTTPYDRETTFTAVLTTNGRFRDLHRERFEPADASAISPDGHRLVLRFQTHDGIDGVNFHLEGGTYVTLRLYKEGHEIDPSSIFVGAFSVHPDTNPFTVYR